MRGWSVAGGRVMRTENVPCAKINKRKCGQDARFRSVAVGGGRRGGLTVAQHDMRPCSLFLNKK